MRRRFALLLALAALLLLAAHADARRRRRGPRKGEMMKKSEIARNADATALRNHRRARTMVSMARQAAAKGDNERVGRAPPRSHAAPRG